MPSNIYNLAKIVQTKNPFEVLANEQKNSEKALDFSVLDYETLCFLKTGEDEVTVYSSEELDVFYEDEFFVEEYKKIVQKYKIKIFTANPSSKQNLFKIRLSANANLTKLNATLLSDEKLVFYEGIKKDILNVLFKQMIKAKILILRLDKNLDQNIEHFIHRLKNGNLQREFAFKVCSGVSSIQAQAGELIFHKTPATTDAEHKKGNFYDDLGYCNPAKKDELLFEFITPKDAKGGRNLRGEYLAIQEQETTEEQGPLKIKNASIYHKDFEDRIEYYAAHYGFFNYDSLDGYNVSKVLRVESIELKTTGSIKTDMNEDITIEVLNPLDEIDDSVKGGIVSIQAPNVKIKGHVGATKINAKNLSISGGTHKKCELIANTAKIKLHRGFLQAKTAIIEKLENAKVRAENVYVKSAVSSEIEADYIIVEKLLTNNKLYPKKALIIEDTLKNGNLIHIIPIFITPNKVFISDKTLQQSNKSSGFISHKTLKQEDKVSKFISDKTLNQNETEYEETEYNDTEYEDLGNLLLEMKIELRDLTKEMENNYEFLVKNQVNAIKLKKLEDKNALSSIQGKLLNVYEKTIQKYNRLVKNYKNTMNLFYEVHSKLEAFKKLETEIYIKAKEIIGDSTIFFDFRVKKIQKKYTLNEKDSGKFFCFDQDSMSVNSTKNYGIDDMGDIRAIFEQKDDFF